MSFDPNRITFFGKTDARGSYVPFGIRAKDRQKHMYIIGKTGMGKSTLLENMAVQDMRNGEGMAFIDPHGSAAETLLDYIPEERKDDVLYFAPFDMEYPVSFNIMEDVGADRRHLVVSGLMSVFKKIWVDAWSARMEYILSNTLLALLEFPDSTLLGVNRVLSDKQYRQAVVDNVKDPSVKSFWVDEFAKYNERYMQEAGDSIKNKTGQFTSNPLIRNIIGQPKSSFDIRKMMDEKKILLMNLSKGLVGESNANLLGSMLTTRIYLAAMSRADLPVEQMKQMPNFYFYVDEFQSFANATFANILSEARKYHLNLIIAHQYIEQMEEEVKNAVFGNVGTTISFRVGPFDAETLEPIFMPQFQAVDICNLDFAQIYLTLMIDGVGSQPFSASTLPPLEKPAMSCRDIVVHASRTNYAKPRLEVEAAINAWHEPLSSAKNDGGQKSSGNNRGNNSNNKPKFDGSNNDRRNFDDRRRDNQSNQFDKKSNDQRKDRDRNNKGSGQKGEPETPKQTDGHQEKSLDDLRSVLAKLSNKEKEKEAKKEVTAETENNEAKPPRKELTEKPEKNEKREKKKHEEVAKKVEPLKVNEHGNLRSALAAALDGLVDSADAKPEVTRETQIEKHPVAQQKQTETQTPQSPIVEEKFTPTEKVVAEERVADEIAHGAPEHPSRHTPESEPEPVTGVTRQDAPRVLQQPSAEPQATQSVHADVTKDPLDPKLLERMLRVTSSDRTPFK